jgi:N-acetylmuramoyl-L-alanine amidase
MGVHVVRQGEHLARIARDYGFSDYRTIWEHPENAELRERRRGNPNILFPGDRLFIPEREARIEDAATDARHRYQRAGSRLVLRVKVLDYDGQPVRSTACDLYFGLEHHPLSTDGDGLIEHPIAPDVEDGKLLVPELALEFDLRIGHLDPIDTPPGQRARLENLRYFAGYSETDTEQLRWAVEEFQCEHGMRATGICDAATQSKLEQAHGA